MSEARLREHLNVKMHYPTPTTELIIKQVNEIKAAMRRERIRETVEHKVWGPFVEPARTELQRVRSLKSQHKLKGLEGDKRWDALCDYEDVIMKTIAVFKAMRYERHIKPSQLVHTFARMGIDIPNNGTHWTDYIKPKDHKRILLKFDGLPQPLRGKRKEPFPRGVGLKGWRLRKEAIEKRLNTELANAEFECDMASSAGNEEEMVRLEALIMSMYKARHILEYCKQGTPLPATWHGLVSLEEQSDKQ